MRRLTLLAALLASTSVAGCAHAGVHGHGHAVSNACTGQPAGVVALGLCPVAISKSTNGARGATVNVSAYSLPAGWSYSAGTLNSDITGSGTNVNLIDNALKGGFYYSGNGTHTLTDFAITSNGTGFPFTTGETSGGSITGNTNLDAEHGSFDGTGMVASGTTMIQPHGTGTFKLAFANALHPARDHFAGDGAGGTYNITNDYFDAFCQNTTGADHCEWLHFFSGAISVTSNYFNISDGTITGSITGGFQLQTGLGVDPTTYVGGPITATFTNNIINFSCVVTNQGNWSLKAVFDNITVNIGTNIFCRPLSGNNIIIVQQADIKVTSVVGTWTAGVAGVTGTGGKTDSEQGGLTGGNNLHMLGPGTGGHFAIGDTLTDQTSGATAVVTSVSYHTVTVNNLGGNVDFSNNPVLPSP